MASVKSTAAMYLAVSSMVGFSSPDVQNLLGKRRLECKRRCNAEKILVSTNCRNNPSCTQAIKISDCLLSPSPVDHLSVANSRGYEPLVKMCGITTPEDAALAAQAGAHYVGTIVWPHSKRSVSLSAVKEICAAATEFGAEPVGVFVSESAKEIEKTCDSTGLSLVQLHGDGARASVLQLSRSLEIIYVMQSDSRGCLQTTISPDQEKVIDWVLVDGLEGGSGLAFDWDKFKVPSLCINKGWFLAGGLNPENVGNAVATLRPNAVDVASGIAGPGGISKDPHRILAFMQAIQASGSRLFRHSVNRKNSGGIVWAGCCIGTLRLQITMLQMDLARGGDSGHPPCLALTGSTELQTTYWY